MDFSYLSQRKGPSGIFELVLYRSQLSEFREIRKRLQLADGSFQLLLIFYHKKLQQTEHLEGPKRSKK